MALMNSVIQKYEREAVQRIKEAQAANRKNGNGREDLFWKPPAGSTETRKLQVIPATMKPPKSIWDAKPVADEQSMPAPQSTVCATVQQPASKDYDSMSQRIVDLENALEQLKRDFDTMRG